MQITKLSWTKIFSKTRRVVSGVMVLFDEDTDISEKEWLKAASKNDAFDFLDDKAEEIYILEDGKNF